MSTEQIIMEKKYFLCVFFVVLLVSPAPILTEALEKERETENKRQAQALLPLAYYAGMTVSAPLFFALVAAYGIYAVTSYAIKRAGTLYYASKGILIACRIRFSTIKTIL